MASYNKEQKEETLNTIFSLIESGKSLRYALNEVKLSSSTFFIWIDADEVKSKQYERVTELRAEYLFDEIIDIAYTPEIGTTQKDTERGIEVTTSDMLGHRRLKIDAIKWSLSKMIPKKYGDKIESTNVNIDSDFAENAEERRLRIDYLKSKLENGRSKNTES